MKYSLAPCVVRCVCGNYALVLHIDCYHWRVGKEEGSLIDTTCHIFLHRQVCNNCYPSAGVISRPFLPSFSMLFLLFYALTSRIFFLTSNLGQLTSLFEYQVPVLFTLKYRNLEHPDLFLMP